MRTLDRFILNNDYKISALFFHVTFSNVFVINVSLMRCYSCESDNNINKVDVKLNNLICKLDRQDTRQLVLKNQGHLYLLKKEILGKNHLITPLLVSCIERNIWPMLEYAKQILELVALRQKYLALLSSKYGIRSKCVENQIQDWLTRLDLRVYAIESVHRAKRNLRVGLDEFVLKRKHLLAQLNYLKFNELLFFKSLPVKCVFITNNFGGKLLLGMTNIKDRIVQTLFLQVIDPILDVHADKYSFGFRKGRNSHQAIGCLSRLLYSIKRPHKKGFVASRLFIDQKYVMSMKVENFRNAVNHK